MLIYYKNTLLLFNFVRLDETQNTVGKILLKYFLFRWRIIVYRTNEPCVYPYYEGSFLHEIYNVQSSTINKCKKFVAQITVR